MKRALLCYLATSVFLMAGCGGGGGGGGSGAGASATAIPSISAQPSGQTVYEGQSATFTVAASGGALGYQWRKGGVDISGATNASYTTPTTTLSDHNSTYSVVVTNSLGTASSAVATLTVKQAAPTITTSPTAQSVIAGQTATFTVSADGRPTLAYQWRKNGADITGANSSSYSTPVTVSDNGSQYSVVVSNTAGSDTSSAAVLTVQTSAIGHLVISEVSSCYYADIDCWFEVYNPTGSAIDLSVYQVQSSSVDVTVGGTLTTTTFNLPSLSVPADGYVVISGNARSATQRGSQMVRLRNGNQVPFWTNGGFVELLNTGATIDFVRFGPSVQTPTTSSHWSGASASAMPYTASDYGKSIVRAYPRSADTDSNTASDWTSVNWSTPAGRNDVPGSATDADADGIPDSAETAGGTFAGLDLYAMGARTGQRNLFIEVDRMNSADPGVIPRSEALQKVVDAFSAKGIAVHFDAGTAFSASFSRASFNLGQGNSLVDYEPCVTFDQTTCNLNSSSRRSIYDWKDDSMDLRRRAIFHYLLFANSQSADGSSGSSGVAELPGNDLIVSMGGSGWGFTTSPAANLNKLINMQASTLMHELGHNLNLRHGGNENTNYKPNYWSVMNYLYQLNGLDATPAGSTAYQRWRMEKGDGTPTLCSLANSPCGAPSLFIMSYSDGSGSALNEANLQESANIGRGSTSGAYADWNLSNSLTSGAIVRDLNADGSQTVLTDHDDWSNLLLPFVRSYSANSGLNAMSTSSSSSAAVPNPITADEQPVAHEVAPPPRFFEELRRAR